MSIRDIWKLFVVTSVVFVIATADCGDGEFCSEEQLLEKLMVAEAPKWIVPRFGFDGFNLSSFNKLISNDNESAVAVKFHHFRRYNKAYPEIILSNTTDPEEGTFKELDPSKPTKIIVHGWLGTASSEYTKTLINAYHPENDYNLIFVDWSHKSTKFYPIARTAVPYVGRILAEFIDRLHETHQIKPEDLHIIGHSLGAHVSGVAGRKVKSGIIGRITGLDPALPLFTDHHVDRLTRESADFVDIIHTCGRFLGWYSHIGHVDFYPNKGVAAQPGCGTDLIGECSHSKAWMYFAESVKSPKSFMAVLCDTWEHFEAKKCRSKPDRVITMGEHVPRDARGSFYLKTNEVKPFGRGMEDLPS